MADRCVAFLNDYHIIAYFTPVIPVPALVINTAIITAAAIITAIVIASAVIVSAIITIAIDPGTVPRSCIGGTSTK